MTWADPRQLLATAEILVAASPDAVLPDRLGEAL